MKQKAAAPSASGASAAPAAQRVERASSQSLPQTPSHASASARSQAQAQASAGEPVLAIAEQPIQFELVDLELPGLGVEGVSSSSSSSTSATLAAAAAGGVVDGGEAAAAPAIVSAESARTAAILRGLGLSLSAPTAPPAGDAPLVVTSEQPAAPTFVQHFVLRFVGCVQVGAERGELVSCL